MATKQELYEEAKARGLNVTSRTTKAELESLVAPNFDGEATNGTVKEGDDTPLTRGESVPNSGQTDVETVDVNSDEAAKEADEARTEEEFKFADESVPNEKGRFAGQQEGDSVDEEGRPVDQDGNIRTGGKSYGVSADSAVEEDK